MAGTQKTEYPNSSAFIAIGGNVVGSGFGDVRATLQAVLSEIPDDDIQIIRCSSWYQSSAVPASDQPDFLNAVMQVHTTLSADDMLSHLLQIELSFGRVRSVPNAARTVDLDIISFERLVCDTPRLQLPHPRMGVRKFVMLPLAEIAPDWQHPVTGMTASEMARLLGKPEYDEQVCIQLP